MNKKLLTIILLCGVAQVGYGGGMDRDDLMMHKPVSNLALDEIITLGEMDQLQIPKAPEYLARIQTQEKTEELDEALSAYRTLANALVKAGALDWAAKAYINALRVGDTDLKDTLNSLRIAPSEKAIQDWLEKDREAKMVRIASHTGPKSKK